MVNHEFADMSDAGQSGNQNRRGVGCDILNIPSDVYLIHDFAILRYLP